MPRISDARRSERRRQILVAARGCFLRQGLHPTTMDDIIRASGLSAGAVYGYFATKEDLILAAIEDAMDRLAARLAPVVGRADPPPPAVLIGEIVAEIEGLEGEDGTELRRIALLGWAEAQRSERVRALLAASYARLLAALVAVAGHWRDRGISARDAPPEAVARAFLSFALGHVAQSALLGGPDPAVAAAGLAGLTGGLVAPS